MTETPSPESAPARSASAESPQAPPPPVHAGWAVASLLFFWPLAFSAFTHAFNVYPLWARGDIVGARAASDRVRKLGQVSLWLFGGLSLLFLIGYAIFLVVLFSNGGWDGGYHHDFHDWGPHDDMPPDFER